MQLEQKKLLLYVITSREYLRGKSLPDAIEQALKGGATMVRFREKDRSLPSLMDDAKAIQKLCKAYQVPFIVDDDIAMALNMDADGVHLGQDDMKPKHAILSLGPNKIVGSSVHNEEEAFLSISSGAHYLDCGCLYYSISAVNNVLITKEKLEAVCKMANVPVIGNGGVNLSNVEELKDTGICGISVARGVLDCDDVEAATRALREKVESLWG